VKIKVKPVAGKKIKTAKPTKTKKGFLPDREKLSATKNKGPLVVKVTKGEKKADTTSGKRRVDPQSVKDLKGASYNPRYISEAQLKRLKISMESFGDLSGIVFNVASGVLISGHQRLKTLSGKKSKLVKKAVQDKRGTVAEGQLVVVESDGSKTRIPYREVNWSDQQTEIAANIAANAHGGEFDDIKLGGLLHKLHKGKFDIELTGISELDFRKMVIDFRKGKGSSVTEVKPDDDTPTGKNAESGSKCKCPRCGFKFLA